MTTVEILSHNIGKAIKDLKKDGIRSMSMENLKQVTPTTGLTCLPGEYHRLFPEVAATVARRLRFPIL